MDFEGVMPNGISQRQNCLISLICGILKLQQTSECNEKEGREGKGEEGDQRGKHKEEKTKH